MKITIELEEVEALKIIDALSIAHQVNSQLVDRHPELHELIKMKTELLKKLIIVIKENLRRKEES